MDYLTLQTTANEYDKLIMPFKHLNCYRCTFDDIAYCFIACSSISFLGMYYCLFGVTCKQHQYKEFSFISNNSCCFFDCQRLIFRLDYDDYLSRLIDCDFVVSPLYSLVNYFVTSNSKKTLFYELA